MLIGFFRQPDFVEKIESKLFLGASAMFGMNYTDTRDGKRKGPTLCHVAITNRPHELELDEFWSARLAPSRKGTRFDQVLLVLVVYRLLSPGSEWRLHRHWFERSALGDLLGVVQFVDARLLDAMDVRKLGDCLVSLPHREQPLLIE